MVERLPVHARIAARAAAALWLLVASAVCAQQPADVLGDPVGDPFDDPFDDPFNDPVVLVLKIISSTHARPATGLVLARSDAAGPALVMVPAAFVSAGDEIVVLDGGTDILRNGRTTRTVARSAKAGVALLEVEGLQRAGVALNADAWPPAAGTMLHFEAWPAADALAEGAPRRRIDIRLAHSEDGPGVGTEPALPALSGPLFDRCGRLAGWHLSAAEPRFAGAGVLRDFIADAGFALDLQPCGARPAAPAEADAGDVFGAGETNTEPAARGTSTDSDPMRDVNGDAPGAVPSSPGRYGRLAALVALVLMLGAFALYLGRGGRKRGKGPRLEGHDADGASVRIPLNFDSQGQRTQVERAGVKLVFEKRDGRLLVIDAGDEAGPLALAVGGTPCLPGEHMYVDDGKEILIAEERYTVRLGQEQKAAKAVAG